jgi:hypothetical protein
MTLTFRLKTAERQHIHAFRSGDPAGTRSDSDPT